MAENTLDQHKPNDKVIIIGAACTGLSLAQGLRKAGIPFSIYERNVSLETRRNWSYSLHWGFIALEALLPEDLLKGIEKAQVDPRYSGIDPLPLGNGETGETIKTIIGSEEGRMWRLRSDKTRRWLASGIDIQFSKEVIGVDYASDGKAVTAYFSDGVQDTGALLVGCDGSRSSIRSLLLGAERSRVKPIEEFATAMCYSKHTREHALYLRSPPFQPINQPFVHPKGYVAWLSVHDAEDSDHPENWTFFHYISYGAPPEHHEWDDEKLIQYQKQIATSFADPIKSIYEWMDERSPSSSAWFTRIQNWDPSLPEHAWTNHEGRVTLAGDAAHPMSFQRGQGLNNALLDSSKLCKSIKELWRNGVIDHEAKPKVIGEYENEMIERGGKEVKLGADNTKLLHDWERMTQSGLVKQGLKGNRLRSCEASGYALPQDMPCLNVMGHSIRLRSGKAIVDYAR